MPQGQEGVTGPDRRGPISWEQLELPFGDGAHYSSLGRVSLKCDPVAEAEKFCAQPWTFLRARMAALQGRDYWALPEDDAHPFS